MKFFAIAAVAALMGFGGVAQAASPLDMSLSNAYVGVRANAQVFDNSSFGAGVAAGYHWNQYLATELNLDHMQNHTFQNTAMVHMLASYPVPNTSLTPYVIVGAGLAFNDSFRTPATQQYRYDFGAGVAVAVTQNVSLDLRYTNNRAFNPIAGAKDINIFSLGVVYRF